MKLLDITVQQHHTVPLLGIVYVTVHKLAVSRWMNLSLNNSVHFSLTMTKYPTKKKSKEGFILAHSLGMQTIILGKQWQQGAQLITASSQEVERH